MKYNKVGCFNHLCIFESDYNFLIIIIRLHIKILQTVRGHYPSRLFLKLPQMMMVDFVSKLLKLLYENSKTSMEARNVPRGSPHVWINSIRLISITKENGNKKRIVNQAKSGWNGIKVRPWIPKLLSENSRLKRLFSLGDTYRPMCSRHRLLCKTLGI